MISSQKLASVFVEMADTLVDDFDLVDFLHNLTGHATEIADAMAAGILLADHRGLLRFMAASSDQSQIVELFQIQNSEGPCLDCYRTGTPVINTDLRAAGDRWPVFAPRASRAGFGSVHALPMRLRDQVIGTLNIFGAEGARLDASDVAVVQALADVATIAILQERSVRRAETLTEQLHGALNSRVAIEQAKGALSKMLGVGTDQAFTLMRSHARSHRLRLEDVAQTVLDDPRSIPELTTPS
ncbi:GAF and ANTAR domain-containing protein [Aeromicrobium fastidiosum]|uniref:GAF and ANTAR domain-containing protein n=1 Tax=Aeromicrobium fastidiosum TaxID=52699 RepID=UPI00202327B8|nr:GAF and ANTAR domain-containing protein [Aeromicrobium fastidiosum]MCL8251138.1 GAF and ANTAR domain-containing protein [Aeromicrobium fastidiosum]